MAAEDGRADHPLIRRLRREAHAFSFFQAVRLVQSLYPDAPRVGEQGPPADEVLRFRVALGLDFPPCDLPAVEVADEPEPVLEPDPEEAAALPAAQARYTFTTTFLGLYGTSSPLPSSYTEDLLDQEPDSLERGFYDLFQHRLHSLFFRAWERYRYPMRFLPDGSDYFSHRLSRLLHIQPDVLPEGHALRSLDLLGFAGLLSQEPRSAASLVAVLRAALPEREVEVEPFVGRWLRIPDDQRARLGAANSTLGLDLHLGENVLDRCSTFRVVIVAGDLEEYVRLLPGGDLLVRLRELIDVFNTDALDYEVEVRLSAAVEVPSLGGSNARLGWSTWMGAPAPAERHVRVLFQGALHGGG